MLSILLRRLPHPLRHRHVITRTLVDLSAVTPVRDRALDHAVEKEHNLIPLLALKDLLKSSPSKSLPLSLIKSSLSFPTRPIDFIRRYPSVFEEHLPAGVHPHVKLTPQTLTLDEEEQLVLNSETQLLESADRVLKLLMMVDSKKIPIPVIERLRFDLGLPNDFTETLIPNFPDYFRVNQEELELVCRNGDLSISVIEKKAKNYEKGMPIEFPMKFSRGFEIEKKFKKWVDDWQKLPYVSPYENAMYLSTKSDEGDKWVVAVLHEVLSLLYSKKTDRENLLFFGECLGLRTRFKQALLHHPGIFYISRKIGSHTVVLRDGYKRDLLTERHTLMEIRYKYIHLMNTEKEDKKQKVVVGDVGKEKKPVLDTNGEGEEREDGDERELDEVSGSEVDDESEDDYSDEDEDENEDEDEDDDEEDENENKTSSHKNIRESRGGNGENTRFEGKRGMKTYGENRFNGSSRSRTRNHEDNDGNENEGRRFSHENNRGNRDRTSGNPRFEGKRVEFGGDRSNERRSRNYEDNNNNDEGRNFSRENNRGNRGRTSGNPRFEGKRVEFGGERSNQRRSRNYEDNNNNNEGRKFSNNNSRGARGRTNNSPRFGGNRAGFGRDGPSERRTRNYEAKDEDEGRKFSQENRRNNRGDSPRFEVKRDFKTFNENGRDGSYQKKSRNYEDKNEDGDRSYSSRGNRGRTRDNSRFEGKRDFEKDNFSGKRNDRGKSKESRYKGSSRSGVEASA